MGLEGLVSKHRDRAYRGGPCRHWVKIKNPELAGDEAGRRSGLVAVMERPQKITFGEMRESGVRGLLIYCADYHLQPLDSDQRRSTTSGYPTLSPGSCVRPAATRVQMSGRISVGTRKNRLWLSLM
jgi:hypothetical protein